MSYNDVADLTVDMDLRKRVTACAAIEKAVNPWYWVDQHMWEVAAQPGWAAAYASALADETRAPDAPPVGRDESVITDGMILSAVQAVKAALEQSQGGEA